MAGSSGELDVVPTNIVDSSSDMRCAFWLCAPCSICPEELPCRTFGGGVCIHQVVEGTSGLSSPEGLADFVPRMPSTPRMADGFPQRLVERYQRAAALGNAVDWVTSPISRDVEAQLPAVTN